MKIKKKKSLILLGLLSMILIAGLMAAACKMDGGDTDGSNTGSNSGGNNTGGNNGGTPPAGPAVVTVLALNTLVAAPREDDMPGTGPINTAQYTGTIAWQTNDGTPHDGAFVKSVVYKAVLTLTAKSGFTFTGLGADKFTHPGAASVTNAAGSGTVTITFLPAVALTLAGGTNIGAYITAPARDALPASGKDVYTWYTYTIDWQTEDGTPHTGPFAPSTVYKAVVTFTAKHGYTFNGMAANKFVYTKTKITSITNPAGTGKVMVVTIVFVPTAPPAISDLELQFRYIGPRGSTTGLTSLRATLSKGNIDGWHIGTVTISYSGANYRWLLDGVELVGETGRALNMNVKENPVYTLGDHWLTVIATDPNTGASYSGNIFFVVVD